MMVKAWLLLVIALLLISVRLVAANYGPEALHYIQIHAWLMWSSFGLLLPLGAILIRLKGAHRYPTLSTVFRSRFSDTLLFSLHVFVQCVGAGSASAGIMVLLITKRWELSHTHQKLGMALGIIVLVMPFIGMFHPTKGTKLWPYWFVVHWLVGTGVIILGIVNVFIGIHIYQDYLHEHISPLNIGFTVQVAFMGLVYFFQDRWSYIFGQGINENPKPPEKNSNALTNL